MGHPFLDLQEADVQDEVELDEEGKDDPPDDDIDWEDEVYAESVLTHDGAVRFGPAKEALGEGEAS